MANDPRLAAILAMPPQHFALIDGAHFDDLALLLPVYGLSGSPLYLEGGDPESRGAAGFLVALHDEQMARAALALIGEKPAGVFWSWPAGEASLYRHLRTLNLVEIPNEARAEAEADGADVSDMPAYESVLFRHWDPNVLASLLPLLDATQRTRFLGASAGLVLDAPDYGGLKSLPRPPELRMATVPGLLRITPEQVEGVRNDRVAASRRRISDYLKDLLPEVTARMEPQKLAETIANAERRGKELGMGNERALGFWAYLVLISDSRLIDDPAIEVMLRQFPGQEDAALFEIGAALSATGKRHP